MCFHTNSSAQTDRITAPLDDTHRFTIHGIVHRQAQSLYDQGRVDPALRMERITLVLNPSDAQAADLDRLLAGPRYIKSNYYHQWLTPESYAARFGLSDGDVKKIVDWLTAHGLSVTGVSRAHNAITLSGRAERIEDVFQTEIHMYAVAGEIHYGNATEPSFPSALEGIVAAIHGLHDFRLRPRTRKLEPLLPPETESTTVPKTPLPGLSIGNPPALAGSAVVVDGTDAERSETSGKHRLTPDDFVRMFGKIKPVHDTAADGSPYSIVIVGQSQIDPSRLMRFGQQFDLGYPQLTVTLVPNSQDPGIRRGDDQQSELDLAWASAVAPRAILNFVYSDNVVDAVQYAVDQNLGPVLGISYGACLRSSPMDVLTLQTWAKQANAQGLTWVSGSGDSGAAGCYQSPGPGQ
jgi:subtilase family serine protease